MAGNRTIPRLWRDSVARNTGTAYLVDEGDTWREVSWADAAERVELLANGLLARGVRKGDAFGILARTTLEWALFDFALGHVGAIGVGIYANSSSRDAQYVLAHSSVVRARIPKASPLRTPRASRPLASSSTRSAASAHETSRQVSPSSTRYAVPVFRAIESRQSRGIVLFPAIFQDCTQWFDPEEDLGGKRPPGANPSFPSVELGGTCASPGTVRSASVS